LIEKGPRGRLALDAQGSGELCIERHLPSNVGTKDWSRIDAMKLKISVSKICLVGKADFYWSSRESVSGAEPRYM
jgi:hypothetical protein